MPLVLGEALLAVAAASMAPSRVAPVGAILAAPAPEDVKAVGQ
jgi:hypothetical protein